MQIKGVELEAFMHEAWPGSGTPQEHDWYWDHDLFDEFPEADITYDTDDLGSIMYQGSGVDPTNGSGYDLAKLLKAWRKSRTHDIISIDVPKDKMGDFKAYLKSIQGSVLK